jgi:hypothetical protein
MQELGETRQELTKSLLSKLFKVIDSNPNFADVYYIMVHAKPEGSGSPVIRQKIVVMHNKPSMMLSTLLFKVDLKRGELTLEWALPGDWPTYTLDTSVGEPVPEVIASIKAVGDQHYRYG